MHKLYVCRYLTRTKIVTLRKLITEFAGTFFLVLTVGIVAATLQGYPGAMIICIVLSVLIFAGAGISGAHYNPAVTLACLLNKRLGRGAAAGYIIAQCTGAIAAAFVVAFFIGNKLPVAASALPGNTKALLAELSGTFILIYVGLNASTAKGRKGNMFYGLSVGLTVLVMIYAIGAISGSILNPALAIGMSIMKFTSFTDIWIYMIGCFSAGILGAIVYRLIHANNKKAK